jgi:hypothetical protein
MAFLSAFYPQPVVKGTTAGTYAEGDRVAQLGAGSTVRVSPSNASTVERSLRDRFAETVKVADFGAVGNGTTDDAAAIQMAIDYAISLGNAVVEFEPKTYNLINFKANSAGNTWPLSANRNHMEIHGGTSSTRLILRGNGAKLYTDQNTTNNLSYFFAVTSELFCLEFHDLTFERGPQTRGALTNFFAQGECFIAMRPVSTQPIDHVTVSNVTFINGFSGVFINSGFSCSKTTKKLRLLEWINCRHLHTRGCGCTASAGGSQMLNLSSWIDVFKADGVYADGAVGAKIPDDVNFPVDGWLYQNPCHTIITNSHFQNMWVEGLFLSDSNEVTQLNSFIQPAINSQVTVTVRNGIGNSNEELIVGKMYLIKDFTNGFASAPEWKSWTTGVYRIDAAPSPLVVGSQITMTRMEDRLVFTAESAIPSLEEGTAAGQTIGWGRMVEWETVGNFTGSVDNCTFVSNEITRENGSSMLASIKVTNGGSGYTSAPTVTISGSGGATATATIANGAVTSININNFPTRYFYTSLPIITISDGGGSNATAVAEFLDFRMAPAIYASTPSQVTNCYFENCSQAANLNPSGTGGVAGFINFSNNVIYSKASNIIGVPVQNNAMFCASPYSTIANNKFINKTPNIICLAAGRQGTKIQGNVFYSLEPAQAGGATKAITTNNSTGNASSQWQMQVDDNYFYGFNYGISGLSPCVLGQIKGDFVTAPTNVFYQTKGSQFSYISQNNTRYILSITNDGELEVAT